MKYADAHHIVLNITENDLKNLNKINIDILKLLSNYANSHNIHLNINDYRLYYEIMKDIFFYNNIYIK